MESFILPILLLTLIISLLNLIKQYQIEMTQEELKAGLEAANATVDKIKTEIQALKDAIANAGNVPAEVQAAAETLFANLQTADEMNEDQQ